MYATTTTVVFLLAVFAAHEANAGAGNEEALRKYYNKYAVSGQLTLEGLQKMSTDNGLSKEVGTKAFNKADTNNNGIIEFDEFLKLINSDMTYAPLKGK